MDLLVELAFNEICYVTVSFHHTFKLPNIYYSYTCFKLSRRTVTFHYFVTQVKHSSLVKQANQSKQPTGHQ